MEPTVLILLFISMISVVLVGQRWIERTTRSSYGGRLDRLERLATTGSLKEIDEQPEAVRLNLALDGGTILDLYNQTLAPGGVPVSRDVEEATESSASASLPLGRFTPGLGRKRSSTQRTSFAPEREPVRAIIAVERQLQESHSIRSIDLSSSFDNKPILTLLDSLGRSAGRQSFQIPDEVRDALRRAWEAQIQELADQSLAALTGFVKVRADFSISSADSGDLLLEAHSNSERPSSRLSIVCRQEHVLDAARAVLVPGETVRATCFGNITRWDEKRRALVILPIGIYS